MNPLWLFTKAAGITLVAVAGMSYLIKQLAPKPSDLITGAVHFRKGVEEFQKGFTTVLFGSGPQDLKKTKEASKIPID
ncbi:MAG: hypothetical protein HY913_06395 [Desulfomonile tiedjei]|nr:hypothetical protein [Desulfomonile tiedjei]